MWLLSVEVVAWITAYTEGSWEGGREGVEKKNKQKKPTSMLHVIVCISPTFLTIDGLDFPRSYSLDPSG